MGLLNNVQKVDGPDTFLISLWQRSYDANGIHCTQFVNCSNDRHGRPRSIGREDRATGGAGGGTIPGRFSLAGTEATGEGLA